MTLIEDGRAGLSVRADDRLRLLTAALLLTDIPAREQQQFAHKVHPLAEMTASELNHLRAHGCVRTITEVADEWPFLVIAPHVLRLSWPDLHPLPGVIVEPWEEIPRLTNEEFLRSFRNFRDEVERVETWKKAAPAWEALVRDLSGVLAGRDLAGFLALFWGDTGRGFTALPNPLAPRLGWIGLYAPEAYYAVLPVPAIPPDSPEPLMYASRPPATRYVACHELSHGAEFRARHRATGIEAAIGDVMARTPANERFKKSYPGVVWPFSEILLRAIQVLYARHHEDAEVGRSFVRRHHENEGLQTLVDWADQMEPYLEGRRSGRYQGWDEYLPIFLAALSTAA